MLLAVFGVLFATVLMVCSLWAGTAIVERAERDSNFRRRILIGIAVAYVIGALSVVVSVASGEYPKPVLLSLAVPAFIVWHFLKAGKRVKDCDSGQTANRTADRTQENGLS